MKEFTSKCAEDAERYDVVSKGHQGILARIEGRVLRLDFFLSHSAILPRDDSDVMRGVAVLQTSLRVSRLDSASSFLN
jgi:hypothetical protein